MALFAAAVVSADDPAPAAAPSPVPPDGPSIKVGATIFADYTYTSEPEVRDATGALVSPSAFDVTRAYVNVTGTITPLVSFRITPDIRRLSTSSQLAPGESVSSRQEGSLTFRLKFAFGQIALDRWLGGGAWVRVGLQQTPYLDLLEGVYRYRFAGPMFAQKEGYLDTSDFGLSARWQSSGEHVEILAGVFNGETFVRGEANDRKALQARASLRPFASSDGAARGLRVTGFVDRDNVVQDAARDRWAAALTFEHPHLHAGAEYLRTLDQPLPTSAEIEGRGFSIWATPRTSEGFEALLRFDRLTPDARLEATRQRVQLGVAWWFPVTRPGTAAALMIDRDHVTSDAALARPDETRWALHCLFAF